MRFYVVPLSVSILKSFDTVKLPQSAVIDITIFFILEISDKMCYNAAVTASYTGDRKEVFPMQEVLSFLVAVAAGVTCHYIIKWLDSDE